MKSTKNLKRKKKECQKGRRSKVKRWRKIQKLQRLDGKSQRQIEEDIGNERIEVLFILLTTEVNREASGHELNCPAKC